MSDNKFRKLATSGFLFRAYLIKILPMAYLAGIRVKEFTDDRTLVTIPYKYLNKNPFRSMYFACQAMAAELSTGVVAVDATNGIKPAVATLVVGMKAEFSKKATGTVAFTCEDVKKINDAVQRACDTGEGITVTAESVGRDSEGEEVSRFWFTWSFKQRRK